MGDLVRSRRVVLPASYVEAKAALAKCARIDECQKWADDALKLKAYARQMNDGKMANDAQRIRDRAVRRGGELLDRLKTSKGGRPRKTGGPRSPSFRKAAAAAAGLTPDQAKQMIRVARVPEEQFESMVEAANPATVKQLAAIGTKTVEYIKPKPFQHEWAQWWIAVQDLASLPACGLAVLAARRPDMLDELKDDCARALVNLEMWRKILEDCDVEPKKEHRANGSDNARTDCGGPRPLRGAKFSPRRRSKAAQPAFFEEN